MTLNPGETDNLEPENLAGFRALPAYKQGQAAQQKAGKDLIQKSPYTFQSDQDWAYRQGAFDAQQAAVGADFAKIKPFTTTEEAPPGDKAERMVKHIKAGYAKDGKLTDKEKGIAYATAWKAHNAGKVKEGEQQKGADYRDPKEVDYDAIDHDKSVARLRHLAGLGPLKTVYDPTKRVYKNVPTADQPKR